MKKVLLILLLLTSLVKADNSEQILAEIKQLRIDMNKRFEQVDKRIELMQSNMDKRFEQVDKRFEIMQSNIDKRFDTVFSILYILMGLIFASPFIAIYLRDKRESEERKLFDSVKAMLFVFREQALDDEKLSRSLKAAGLI